MTPLPPRDSKSPPYRVQRSRRKGSRLPAGAVCVSRPGKWGNQFRAINGDKATAVAQHRDWVFNTPEGQRLAAEARKELRGKPLACWCGLASACHADTWLEVANAPELKKGGTP